MIKKLSGFSEIKRMVTRNGKHCVLSIPKGGNVKRWLKIFQRENIAKGLNLKLPSHFLLRLACPCGSLWYIKDKTEFPMIDAKCKCGNYFVYYEKE